MPRSSRNLIPLIVVAAVFGTWPAVVMAQEPAVVMAQESEEAEKKKPDIGYLPTPEHVVDIMLGLAKVKEDDLVYDLGCGDGRIVVTAAKKFGCVAVGVEIDPELVSESRANAKAAEVEDLVTIKEEDLFNIDLSAVDVVTLYVGNELTAALIPQLEKLKPGSRIVSHNSPMKGVIPDYTLWVTGGQEPSMVYMWTTPLRKGPAVADDVIWEISVDTAGGGTLVQIPDEEETSVFLRTPFLALLVSLVALALAAPLWLLRKRIGAVRINVVVDKPLPENEEKANGR